MIDLVKTLLARLADEEIALEDETLQAVVQFLYSENEQIAQSATSCLFFCGGRSILDERIRISKAGMSIPHLDLVRGMKKLCEGK